MLDVFQEVGNYLFSVHLHHALCVVSGIALEPAPHARGKYKKLHNTKTIARTRIRLNRQFRIEKVKQFPF
jgi:hypothetical protein